MTENKQNNNDRTDRRPDCVTEIRMGNTVLVAVSYTHLTLPTICSV